MAVNANNDMRPLPEDGTVWLKIFTAVCQTDGYRNPRATTDHLFRSYKKRFPNGMHADERLFDPNYNWKDGE